MTEILIINTGGTFNKVYNPITGALDIDTKGSAIESIAQNWLTEFEIINIIGKDSLDMTEIDREEILKTVKDSNYKSIIVVHGTDTIDQTAKFLSDAKLDIKIVLTGAMVPFSINPIEATANLASSYGYINNLNQSGIFIVINGTIGSHTRVKKNRGKGVFKIVP